MELHNGYFLMLKKPPKKHWLCKNITTVSNWFETNQLHYMYFQKSHQQAANQNSAVVLKIWMASHYEFYYTCVGCLNEAVCQIVKISKNASFFSLQKH